MNNVDVKVVNTRCLYDFVNHYADCIDPHFEGYGPGTPVRVIEITLGPPTQMFPQGEPLLRYKLAAQYETWYPRDPALEMQAVSIFRKPPPSQLPKVLPLLEWPKKDEIQSRILEDSTDLRFFGKQHYEHWKEWFAQVPLSIGDIKPSDFPFLQFPEPRKVKYEVKVSYRHVEKLLLPHHQPIMWTANRTRQGLLKRPRNNDSSVTSSWRSGKAEGKSK